MSATPLALFVYNRPRHAQRALEALGRCSDLTRCRLIIYCDAAKVPEHGTDVAATIEVVRRWASRLGAEVVERKNNLGIAKSIVGAVSNLVESDGRVIVIEDDLVPAPDFLTFMLAGLDRYADTDEVAQISGCLLTGTEPSSYDGLFLPLSTTWGWATWARAWRIFELDDVVDEYVLEHSAAFLSRFTLNGALGTSSNINYLKMLSDRLAGKNDSWGILWWYAVARAKMLVLYPRKSLIWNGGFDGSGVHCGGTEKFQSEAPAIYRQAQLPCPPTLPRTVTVDHDALESLQRHLRANASAGSVARLSRLARRVTARLGLRSVQI
jgi:hypothetical protein